MFNRSNCDRKSQLSGMRTEPLNPCERCARGTKNVKEKKSRHSKYYWNLNLLSIIGIKKSKILAHYRNDWLYAWFSIYARTKG